MAETVISIIAEAGSNYNGDLGTAFELNAAAKKAGADFIKYQIINPEGLYLPGNYSYGRYRIEDVISERQRNVLTDSEWEQVSDHALSKGIPFSASIFDEKGLKLVSQIGPPFIKIASTDLNNSLFIERVAAEGLKTIVSTGMSSLMEIEKAVEVLLRSGLSEDNLILLHCVSTYPVSTAATNLSFISRLKSFGFEVGFSDHSLGVDAAIAALALGATWFEKHFTLDKKSKGLDHKHSLEPSELADYVFRLKEVEQSLIPKAEKVDDSELQTALRARRGVYASANLPVGHVIRREDLHIVRPPSFVPADRATELIGKALRTSIREREAFPLELIDGP